MGKFLKKILIFLFLGFLIGEIISRIFVLTSDVPRRKIDEFGIQKYIPNQNGYWKGGKHKWQINETGWSGILPSSYNNLITIVGDSYIENFMNPDSCHQAIFLKQNLPSNNFFEASRSGVSLIEAFEITKQLDTMTPEVQLIYVHDSDFKESIVEIKKLNDITQLDLSKQKINYGEMKSPGVKNVLYNVKFLYYMYQRFFMDFGRKKKKTQSEVIELRKNNDLELYSELLEYIKENYKIDDKVLVFRPNSDIEIVSLAKEKGFRTLLLDSTKDNVWTFDYDAHWTCYGHEKASSQVSEYLKYYNK